LENGSRFYPFPYSISPIPGDLEKGFIALGTTGIISAASCIAMLLFVIYRALTWRSHYRTFIGYNQYVVLIINLLLADTMQSASFVTSFHWIYAGGIFAPSRSCFTQGFMLNLGDLASGMFVFGIALHTFYGAVRTHRVSHTTFTVLIISVWMFALLLTSIGPLMHRDDYFVRAGPWCWISAEYNTERLALHYIWIFLIQFGTIVLYVLIFLHLKRTLVHILPSTQSTTHAKVDRAAKLMLLFPAAYIILTLPLSAGRMWSQAAHEAVLSDTYALVSGCMLACCGLVDCLLYTLTRRSLLRQNTRDGSYIRSDPEKRGDRSPLDGFDFGAGIKQTLTVTVTGDRLSAIASDDSDTDNDYDDHESNTISDAASGISRIPTIHLSSEKTRYPTMTGYAISPAGSEERMVTGGIEGLDPRIGGMKTEITATASDVGSIMEGGHVSDAEEQGSGIRRDRSPYGVRQALEILRGTSTKR